MTNPRQRGARRLLTRIADTANRLVADRPPATRAPGSNYLRNSDGNGGKVIASGNP